MIAAVKDNASLQLAIDSECQFISVLYGNICTISNIVKKIKNAGKYAFIHVDLLEGASNKEVVIQFLKLVTEADGIISTKASMLKAARAEVFSVFITCLLLIRFRFTTLISKLRNRIRIVLRSLPGCMPKVLGWVTEKIRQPLIAGGLVCDEEDARNAINAGVVALSTTNTGVWTLAKKLL
ncbi:glycerol-3-phosphate responsive antiterminator [Shigella flexneri]